MAWLPRDPQFNHVRIHSFGYESKWSERNNAALNVYDFGKALLGDMAESPFLRKDSDVSYQLPDQRSLRILTFSHLVSYSTCGTQHGRTGN